ncbi:hypothetical protein ACNKHO_16370 [Shigella flexneri]
MAAIEKNLLIKPTIPEAQPAPHQWQKMPFWHKVRPWAASSPRWGRCVRIACSYRWGPAL